MHFLLFELSPVFIVFQKTGDNHYCLFCSFSCALCNKKAPNAMKKHGPNTLLPPITAPRNDKIPKVKNTLPVVFITKTYFYYSFSLFSFFFEHATAMIPMKRLISDKKNAQPNPILRVLPQQPTASANEIAIAKKNKRSASIMFIIYC